MWHIVLKMKNTSYMFLTFEADVENDPMEQEIYVPYESSEAQIDT